MADEPRSTRAGRGCAAGSMAWIAACIVGMGCSSPPPPPPEEPSIPEEPVEKETWGPEPEEPPPEAPAPAPTSGEGELLPDEHDISVADCRLLAAQYADVTRADQVAALKPGLTEAQKAQATANIDSVASKMEEKWSQSCEENLVNKVMAPEALKCALKAKTVAEFDGCLNAPAK